MIVLIAPEEDIKDEISKLHQLFEAGVVSYHLRKPNKNYQEHCNYLNKIDKKYHNRIVVSRFHELIKDYDLKGIHFPEQKRRSFISNEDGCFQTLTMENKIISSSFHEIEELKNCPFLFDYHFLSPVFTSISKPGYEGRGFNVHLTDKTIIGMGGVTLKNLHEFKKLGFQGVGVLGSIWNNKEPAKVFEKLIEQWNRFPE